MIWLATEQDVPRINTILNHPKVRPYVWVGEDVIDIGPSFNMFRVYMVSHADSKEAIGALVCQYLYNGEWVAMSALMPELWGLPGVVAHRMAMYDLFTNTDAVRVYATIFRGNTRAVRNACGLGLEPIGFCGDRSVMELDILNWVGVNASGTLHAISSEWASVNGVAGLAPMESPMIGLVLRLIETGWYGKAMQIWDKFRTLAGFPNIVAITTAEGVALVYRNAVLGLIQTAEVAEDA